MRSDRNIQRAPKRPVASRSEESPTGAPVDANIKVTVKPPSGDDPWRGPRPDRRDRDGGGDFDRRRPPRDSENNRYGRGREDRPFQDNRRDQDERRHAGPRSDDRRPNYRDARPGGDERPYRDERRPYRQDEGDRRPYRSDEGDRRPSYRGNEDDRRGYRPRDEDRRPFRSQDDERRPFRPREEDGRSFRPREEDRRSPSPRDEDRRSFRPRDEDRRPGRPPREGEHRPFRPYDDERRPFRAREGDDHRPYRGRDEGGDRRGNDGPRNDDRRRTARPPKPWEEHAQSRSPRPPHKPFASDRNASSPDRRGTERPQPRSEASTPHHATPAASGPHPDGARLAKVMSDRGLASRREADEWIEAGWVKVDGQMAVLGQRVHEDAVIEIDPAARTQQAKRVTILLHKPIGYVSGQAEDGYEPASVLISEGNHWEEDPSHKPYHPGHSRGLAPAGRLDIDSTGLLVLTQDGRIAKHLIGDDSSVEKEYLVRVEYSGGESFPESDLELLNHGLELDGFKLRPAKVSWANEDQLRFVLREGRKRQIRRMCELVGLKVLGLKRVRIGSVVLGKLPMGQWRYLRDDELF